jgi:hypothetical protein
MNPFFLAAVALAALLAVAHFHLGERYVLIRRFRRTSS